MKIIRVGRSRSNDIVLREDEKISRMHCHFICDDNGKYYVVDINSLNGTYINGIRRQGKVELNINDIVRIGNQTLPWRQYFKQAFDSGSNGNVGGDPGISSLPSANRWGVFGSFMIPILGIILFIVTKNKIRNPRAYLNAAIAGFIVTAVLSTIYVIIQIALI
ncbi:MAG: FHA domain-containing protein [Bacteroidales bacterium]|nr:FHA domain-containing protein [Bacteroidales bacterium]